MTGRSWVTVDQQRLSGGYALLAGQPPREPWPMPTVRTRSVDAYGWTERHIWQRRTWTDVVDAAARCDGRPHTCTWAVDAVMHAARGNGKSTLVWWAGAA
ncbi:hypothetical protein [Actinoplanes sp. URMC 104]|uniref:hypothetical protein n=1 Tax=Actinoplanes sp. URMC 104 TaxID=3423409 RepID=UPI003F1D11B3